MIETSEIQKADVEAPSHRSEVQEIVEPIDYVGNLDEAAPDQNDVRTLI